MKKRLLLCAIASALASGSMAVHAGQQFWVTKTADTFNGRCTPQDCSLRDAIQAANDPIKSPGQNTIGFLFGGTYPIERRGEDNKGELGDLDLLARIKIEGRALDGKTVTIDGQKLDRVLDIGRYANVELNNLAIINGKTHTTGTSDQYGAAGIRNDGRLFMDHCVLAFNETGFNGQGNALSNSNEVIITNSQIVFNKSRNGESAIYSGAQGSPLEHSIWGTVLRISDSLVASNTMTREEAEIPNKTAGAAGITAVGYFDMYKTRVINNINDVQDDPFYQFHSGGILSLNAETTIVDSDISNNEGAKGGGIAINNYNSGNTVISGTTIANNKSNEGGGGGIYWEAAWHGENKFEIVNSTISGNVSLGAGGGISVNKKFDNIFYLNFPIYLHLNNVTIAGNTAGREGGGLFSPEGQVDLKNSIISDNRAFGAGPDCFNPELSPSFDTHFSLISDLSSCRAQDFSARSIFGVSAKLDTLKNNGGFSSMHALLGGSPAIDAGDDATCEPIDQRGVARPQWQHCDIGAYEWRPSVLGN